jgi:hypothetical protein
MDRVCVVANLECLGTNLGRPGEKATNRPGYGSYINYILQKLPVHQESIQLSTHTARPRGL